MAVDLSVVIPLYNEEENVQELFRELLEVLTRLDRSFEVVVVDDGSSDATWAKLEALAKAEKRIVAVRFRRNFGQTAALSAGIERATGAIIVPMDGDLQNDPADIPRLLATMGEGYDCVSGWRFNRQDKAVTRRLPSMVANKIISWISGVNLHDYGCTMKAYKHDVIEGVRLYGEMHRFIPIYSAWQGAKVTEQKVNHRARRFGVSKYGLSRVLKVILDLIVVKFLFGYLTKPIYVFGGFGLGSVALSALCFSIAVYFKLAGLKDFVSTPLPVMTAVFLMIGVQSVLLGLIAEVLVRTYYESQEKRPYLVGKVLNGKG